VDSVKSIKPTRRARIVTIIGLTVVWYVIAKTISSNAVNTVFTSLTLMLYLLVPWTATNLVDFFFVRRGHYAITDLFSPRGIYGSWAWRGLTAYAIGFIVEIPFMVLPDISGWHYTGFIAKHISDVDIAWLVGLLVTSVTYWLLARSLNVSAELTAVKASEGELATVT
jgi:purine-cytosine permease-like protein